MVGLQARREAAGEAERVARCGDDANFRGDRDQVQVGAELGDGGGDLSGDAAAGHEDSVAGGGVVEQPFAELADGLGAHGGESFAIERVVNYAGHFVAIVSHDRIFAQVVQGEIGEYGFGGDSFLFGA